ncbi:hypothetical protein [Arsenicicoccus dermatophilus]|nr:hypothetical protein [Arsenicicoccus dermatophilus]
MSRSALIASPRTGERSTPASAWESISSRTPASHAALSSQATTPA